MPRGTNAKSWIGGFLKNNAGAGLSKYKGLEITIVDPDGKVLWEGQLTNREESNLMSRYGRLASMDDKISSFPGKNDLL